MFRSERDRNAGSQVPNLMNDCRRIDVDTLSSICRVTDRAVLKSLSSYAKADR